MFLQEILNAELRNKYWINFLIYDYIPSFIIKIISCFTTSTCIPKNYKQDPTDGTLLQEILNFNYNNDCFGLNDKDLYKFYKRYKKTIKIQNKQYSGIFNDFILFIKNKRKKSSLKKNNNLSNFC